MKIFNKLYIFCFALTLLNTSADAGTGCLYLGDYIYPDKVLSPTNNPATGNAWYKNTNMIYRRTYAAFPYCGINEADIQRSNPYKACDVQGLGNYGQVVTWIDSKNTCPMPLDTYAVILPIFGLMGAYFLRRRFSLNPES